MVIDLWLKKLFDSTPSFNKVWNTEILSKKPRFNGVCYRDDLSKWIKDGTYVTNLDEFGDDGTHWVALYGEDIEKYLFWQFWSWTCF